VPGLLPSLWAEPRPAPAPPPGWRDWALAGVLAPAAVLEGVLRPDLPWRVLTVLVLVALLPTLLWRRSMPLLMVAIAFGATGLLPLLTGGDTLQAYTGAYLLILPYALIRWGSGREIVAGLAVVAAKAGIWMIVAETGPGDVIGGVAVLVSVSALGAAFRYRSRSRSRELERVKLIERERLARDLHDTIAHHVSAMAIRAQAGLATSAARPEAATEALHLIEAEASQALAEMRAMVRVLRRDQPAELAPAPVIADLHLLATTGTAGPAVEVGIAGDVDDLPPPVRTAIYRLAQESVTNARRHARHATRIEVRVAADDTSVHLQVSDDGQAGPVRPGAPPGYGLIGMSERAGLLGGVCRAGPAPGRGWTVTATLPRTGAAP
jgi:signal transduction histidine kinase